ncbi:MAG: hypothetical protein QNJ38_12410 [Prochloraceae cyanobacterium]|nr:hypothetical protein [Prochloraceae cyanobacterium]
MLQLKINLILEKFIPILLFIAKLQPIAIENPANVTSEITKV